MDKLWKTGDIACTTPGFISTTSVWYLLELWPGLCWEDKAETGDS